jgi:choline dehydrogenase-like flavoprotein
MLDVGRKPPEPVPPAGTFHELKTNIKDPVRYFLGENFEALILPGNDAEYYALAPSKNYVIEEQEDFRTQTTGFRPLVSFAAGGLGEIWCAGCYPLTDADLRDFPFGFRDIAPFYEKVADRIGITGTEDDMTRFYPLHSGLLEPLALDEHTKVLLESYQRHRRRLNGKHRCYMGRARVATLSRDFGDRKACDHLGRCRWGCPTDSIYVPTLTLKECLGHENFTYVDGVAVSHFLSGSGRNINKVVARSVADDKQHEFEVGTLVLAAGTLSSSKIFMDSIYRTTGELITLPGLLDNRQILMPFVNLNLVGRPFDPETYQYQQLVIGLEAEDPHDHTYGLVTTLKSAMIHPIVASIPGSIGTALGLFRNVHAALAMLNINFSDHRRDENQLSLEANGDTKETRLRIQYRPDTTERERIARVAKRYRKILRALGCIAPAGAMHIRPMGASVHYAGTVPMAQNAAGPTTDESCRSRDFENLYFVDGTTFPSLPAKNITFTLMANAARVAELAF